MRSGRAPPAHGRIGLEQSRQGRLGRRRHSLDTSLSTGDPVRRGGGQAINVAGQRWQGAGALGRRERCQRRRSQRIELRRQGEDGVDDGGVRVRHAAAEGGQDCSRASGACAETRRLRAGEIEAAGGAIVLGPQRRLVERRQSLSAVRAAVEQAAPVTRAGDRRRQAPFPPEIGLLVFGQTVRTELKPGGLPPPPPARRKIGAQRQQKRARANPGERHAVDGSGSEARAADEPIPHDRRQREIESAGPGAGTQIERRSERPGRQAVAEGQPMQPARDAVRRALDSRRPANGPTGGRGSGVELRSPATRDPSTSSQQSLALRRAAPARKRDMRERLDRRRCDLLDAIAHGLCRRSRDDPDDLADQPFGEGEDCARDRLV